jgi:hypothetical protein
MSKASMGALKEVVNQFMKDSPADAKPMRQLLASITEKALMAANEYRGFNYQYWLAQGCQEWRNCGEPDFPEKYFFIYGPSNDDTRITFY